jgi:hypothetical protein
MTNEKKVRFARKRLAPKIKRKPHNPKLKDGKAYLDEVPHEGILASLEEPTLAERVNDLTKLSRVRRVRLNQKLAEYEFDHDDFDAEDFLSDGDGLSPYEIDALKEDGQDADVSGREEPSPDPVPPAEQSDEVANGGEATAQPARAPVEPDAS